MRIIDDSPITEPAVGEFMNSKTPVWQLEPNRIYVLSHASDELKAAAERVGEQLIDTLNQQEYINQYGITVLDEPLVIPGHNPIAEALTDGRCDFVMLMKRPSEDDFQFLLVKGEKNKLLETLALMCYTAERVTKASLVEGALKALDSCPDETIKALRPAFGSEEFRRKSLASRWFGLGPKLAFGALPSGGIIGAAAGATVGALLGGISQKLKDLLNIKPDDTSIQKSNKIYSQLDKVIEYSRIHPEEKVGEEVKRIIDDLPTEYLWKVLEETAKGSKDSIKNYDPTYHARQSELRIKVGYRKDYPEFFPGNAHRHTDGLYVLFLEKASKKEHVHFKQRAQFIVYLIYLLDRVDKGDKVEPIRLQDEETLYKSLYDAVYPKDGEQRDNSFFSLVSTTKKGGKSKRTPKFKDALADIRFVIVNSCNKFNEFPPTHFIHSSESHLYTLPDRITIAQNLMTIANSCKKNQKKRDAE